MLNDDKRGAGVVTQTVKQLFKCFEPTGRSTNGDHVGRRLCNCRIA